MIGRTISHYKITEKLGEGGMGVVYKAEDTRLKRDVALKFLPTHLLGNADIRARFEREAQAAAALHHPNICPVFEIDEVNGKTFIAMAFIEGESLDKKIAQGPLKLEEAGVSSFFPTLVHATLPVRGFSSAALASSRAHGEG